MPVPIPASDSPNAAYFVPPARDVVSVEPSIPVEDHEDRDDDDDEGVELIQDRFLSRDSPAGILVRVRGYTNHLSPVGKRLAWEQLVETLNDSRVGTEADQYRETVSKAHGSEGLILRVEALNQGRVLAVVNTRLTRDEEDAYNQFIVDQRHTLQQQQEQEREPRRRGGEHTERGDGLEEEDRAVTTPTAMALLGRLDADDLDRNELDNRSLRRRAHSGRNQGDTRAPGSAENDDYDDDDDDGDENVNGPAPALSDLDAVVNVERAPLGASTNSARDERLSARVRDAWTSASTSQLMDENRPYGGPDRRQSNQREIVGR